MAKFWKELIGGQVKNGIYVAGPRHASSKLASFSSGNPPRLPFQYIVHFQLNENIEKNFNWKSEPYSLAQMVKTVEMPGVTLVTEKRPKYNRNVPVMLSKEFKPFTVTVHDDVSSTWQRFWQVYYNYHLTDGRHVYEDPTQIINRTVHNAKGIIPEDQFNSQFQGIDIKPATRSQFIDNIHIYHLHGETVTRTTAVNPMITDVQATQLDYAGAGTSQEITFQIEYEKIMYSPVINFKYDEEQTFLKDAIEDFTKATPFNPTGDKIRGIVKSLFGLTQRAGNSRTDLTTLSDAPRVDYGGNMVDIDLGPGESVGFFGNLIRNAVRKKANELTSGLLKKNNKNLGKFKI